MIGEQKMKCHRCKYQWETKSKMIYVSCPKCLTKVKIRLTKKQMAKNFVGLSPTE